MNSEFNQNDTAEEWRPVPGAEGCYSASTLGRVRSEPMPSPRGGKLRGRVLTPGENRKGYLQFRVCLPDGRQWSTVVHRAIAAAFLGPCPDGMQVNHKDGDKKNNRPENLEYVTCRDNVRHSWASGLHANDDRKGEAHNMARLTEEDVRTIRAIYPAKTVAQLGATFGVSPQCIRDVVKRRTWQHVA